MKSGDIKKTPNISETEFAHLGGGALAYIREIEGEEATRLLGKELVLAPDSKLFCVYHANGMPISISGTREAAVGTALEHELVPMSVH